MTIVYSRWNSSRSVWDSRTLKNKNAVKVIFFAENYFFRRKISMCSEMRGQMWVRIRYHCDNNQCASCRRRVRGNPRRVDAREVRAEVDGTVDWARLTVDWTRQAWTQGSPKREHVVPYKVTICHLKEEKQIRLPKKPSWLKKYCNEEFLCHIFAEVNSLILLGWYVRFFSHPVPISDAEVDGTVDWTRLTIDWTREAWMERVGLEMYARRTKYPTRLSSVI